MYEGCVQVFVCAFVKFIEKNICLVMSVCPPVFKKIRLEMHVFSLHLVFHNFSIPKLSNSGSVTICQNNSNFSRTLLYIHE